MLVSSGIALDAAAADLAARRADVTQFAVLERLDDYATAIASAVAVRARLLTLVLSGEPWVDLAVTCVARTAQATVIVIRRRRDNDLRIRLDRIRAELAGPA